MMLIAVTAIVLSASALSLLAWRDPKRLRSMSRAARRTKHVASLTPRARRGLGVLVLAPGLALAVMSAWIPFFVWLGTTCTFGWAITQVLARSQERPVSENRPMPL